MEVEGDSLLICNALKNGDSGFTSYGGIIDETHLLAASFRRISFSHVKRDGNRAAHLLARWALDLQEDFVVWLENVPDYLEPVIHSKLLHFQ